MPPSRSRPCLGARRLLAFACEDEDDDDEDDGGRSAMVVGGATGLGRCALRGAAVREASWPGQAAAREHAAVLPQRFPRPAQSPAICKLPPYHVGTVWAGASAASGAEFAKPTSGTERQPLPQLTIHGAEQHQPQDGRSKLGTKERGAVRGGGRPSCCSLRRARVPEANQPVASTKMVAECKSPL